jgi:hypothetical protein
VIPVARPALPSSGPPESPADITLDPPVALERLAKRLEAAHEAAPDDAALARVLKDTLLALGAAGKAEDDAFMREFGSA